MEEPRNTEHPAASAPRAEYAAPIETMSERWRALRREEASTDSRSFLERNYLALGLGIGLLILIAVVILGGFLLLVRFAH